jgi:uncharacterized YigZ family protein
LHSQNDFFRKNIKLDTYKTIKSCSEGIYKEKGSKFLAFALPVRTADEVKNLLAQHRKEYYDARHVCYAYRLGADKTDFRANDDGEPSGTAGKPILGQIVSNDLTDTLIIVVRYFGGVLLGTGGLIVAYREAAADAFANAEIIEKTVDVQFSVHFPYEAMNAVMKVVKDENITIIEQQFDNECFMKLNIWKANYEMAKNKFLKIEGLKIEE